MHRTILGRLMGAVFTLVLLGGCDKPPDTPPPQRSDVVQKTAPGSDPAAHAPSRTVEQGRQ